MQWIRICSALVATFGLTAAAQAGLFGHDKDCGCADTYQPECCAPVITRPCHTNVFTYQRACSDIKPPCCDIGCAPGGCAPKHGFGLFGGHGHHGDECCPVTCCQPAAACVAPQACAPQACGPVCTPPPTCDPWACASQGCAPQACGCAPKKSGLFGFGGGGGLFGGHHHKDDCCPTDCAAPGDCCPQGCYADPCEIACLIYESQTACYAKQRRKAIHKLGDNYSCVCNPEIMCAFIYALNDADEGVRKKAADEIGDQLKDNPCCCNADVVAALTYALADCDKGVRRQAEQALEACGYEIVDGYCDVCCDTTCAPGCAPAGAPAGAPVPAAPPQDTAPAPAPPADAADPEAYFPRRVQPKQAAAPKSRTSRLASMFGLAR